MRLTRIRIPNNARMTPETLLIHSNQRGVNLPRSKLRPPVRTNHHRAEPVNTPSTTVAAEMEFLFAPRPIPAKITANEGLVRVSRNVETYAPEKLLALALAMAARSAGLVSTVLRPR